MGSEEDREEMGDTIVNWATTVRKTMVRGGEGENRREKVRE